MKEKIEAHIKFNILSLIDELIPTLEQKKIDVLKIKEISSHIIHTLSVYQDKDSKHMAIVTYALYNVLKRYPGGKGYTTQIIKYLKNARKLMADEKINQFRKETKKIITLIAKVDKTVDNYIRDVVDQSEIIKASKMYEHGVSIERAADIIGISQWEVMNYVGNTTYSDDYGPSDVNSKIKYVKKIFNVNKKIETK